MRLLATLWLVPSILAAQEFDFHTRGPYRPGVPRPDSLLGFAIGSQHTMYHQQQQVFDRMIAAAPDRVRTEVIGRTAEGKVMRLLIISAPENLARLDEIRGNLARLADPRRTSAAEARDLADRTPATALLTHSVHGNEPAGFESAMETVYQLLASEEPATLDVLRNVVVLINPSQNPDGHERFAAWSNSVAVGSDDPATLEQTEPWSIWGRFNHYRFDMNRDLLAQSQNESKALASVYVRWRPQVVVDLHSTTEQYFFPPVSQAHNPNLPPATFGWFERYGRSNAQAFDRYGWQYYVRDIFDFFYPGYIDMWPSMRGAVGMTYETDGGPELRKRKADGSVMTFRMAIAHHFIASLATLDLAARSRVERLRDFHDFHVTGMTEVQRRPLRRVVFSSADPARTGWLVRRLLSEEVEVTRLAEPWTTPRANSYFGGAAARQTFPAGSYVVDLKQPQARLATTMLEPRAAFDSGFVRSQLAKYQRNQRRGEEADRDGYDFYDVTGWSLPYSLGIEAWWTDDTTLVTGRPVTSAEGAPLAAPSRAQSSYLFGNETEAGTRLAMRLLRDGFRVGITTASIVADGQAYPQGTFVVRVQRNPETVHGRIATLAPEVGARVVAVQSAFPDSGQYGPGSETVAPLKAPRILLAAGEGVDQTAFGSIWFYFERELGVPVTLINLAALGYADLAAYNALIIPDGSSGRMGRELGEGGVTRLKQWIEGGATVVGIGESVSLLGRKDVGLTTVTAVVGDTTAAKDTTAATGAPSGPPLVSPTAAGGRNPEYVPGSIFRGTLDRTHWLTFGYQRDQLPVFLETSTMLKPSQKGANPVAFTGPDLLLSGWSWPKNTEKLLQNSVFAAVESVGNGRVVLFAGNPVYRGYWRGPAKLLTNAVLVGPNR
jgi:hypothetical protein